MDSSENWKVNDSAEVFLDFRRALRVIHMHTDDKIQKVLSDEMTDIQELLYEKKENGTNETLTQKCHIGKHTVNSYFRKI